MSLFHIVPPRNIGIFPHISRINPARFGLLGTILGIVTAVLLVQTIQINHFRVLGAQTGDFLSKYGYRASESSDRYALWRERVRIRSDWRDGWIMVGRLALEAKQYDDALIAVNRALLLDPNHEESRKLLGEILDARGELKENRGK